MTHLRRQAGLRADAVVVEARLFDNLMHELARRGAGVREAGAFLLGRAGQDNRLVSQLAYYDDLDPGSLTGGITFTATGYSALGAICRDQGLQVVADIHTHPGPGVRQSTIDAGHPMVAIPGHIAFIAPNFACPAPHPLHLGAHRLEPGGRWTSYYGGDIGEVLTVVGPGMRRRALVTAGRAARAVLERMPWRTA